MKTQYIVFTLFALCAVSFAVAVGQTYPEHTGAACIPDTTDCDDMLPAHVGGSCFIYTCEGGASDFSYCQIATGEGGCQTSGQIEVNCGSDCEKWDCGEPSGAVCDFTECDTTGEGEAVQGEVKLVSTCT